MSERWNLGELRKAFDESFAAPYEGAGEPRERMLAIRAGDGRFVVRLSEIGGVEAIRKIVPLPSALPGLFGIAGVRRRVLAVYGLGALLGAGATEDPPRWLLLGSASGDGIALAIEELEHYTEIAASRIHPAEAGGASGDVAGIVEEEGRRRVVLNLPSLFARLRSRAERGKGPI